MTNAKTTSLPQNTEERPRRKAHDLDARIARIPAADLAKLQGGKTSDAAFDNSFDNSFNNIA